MKAIIFVVLFCAAAGISYFSGTAEKWRRIYESQEREK